VLGKTERRWWQLSRPNLIRFFMREAPGIDLHIVDPNG
jgi:K+-sensing histidine kinase KdpD